MQRIEDYFKLHSGRIFILGNGQSLIEHDLSRLDPIETITINRAWKMKPGALYHCCSGDLRGIREEPQNIFFLGQESQYPQVPVSCPVVLVQTRILGAKFHPPTKKLDVPPALDLRLGWPPTHCGLFAIFGAWWLGFEEIYLLGYDGYGGHYTKKDWDLIIPEEKVKEEFRSYIRLFQEETNYKVEIYNCNLNNAYKNLPFKDFCEVT